MKYKIRHIFILPLILIFGGCTTPLWERHYYTEETITHFLISEDYTNLVVIGEKYHYIFDENVTKLNALLSSEVKSYLRPKFSHVKVNHDQAIELNVLIYIDPRIPEHIETKFGEIWYENQPTHYRYRAQVIDLFLKGTRYLGKDYGEAIKDYQLNNEYKIKVEEPDSSSLKAKKVLLTPITVTVDGIVLTGFVAGAAVYLTLSSPAWIVMCFGYD